MVSRFHHCSNSIHLAVISVLQYLYFSKYHRHFSLSMYTWYMDYDYNRFSFSVYMVYVYYIILYYILGILGYAGKIFHTWILLGYIQSNLSCVIIASLLNISLYFILFFCCNVFIYLFIYLHYWEG